MKFKCPSCQNAFSVPDEMIPQGKPVRFSCPKCKTSIGPITFPAEPSIVPDQEPKSSQKRSPIFPQETSLEEQAMLYDVVEEGVPTALVWVGHKDSLAKIERALEAMEYQVRIVSSAEMAVKWWNRNPYKLIVVDEIEPGQKPEDHPFVAYCQTLPMRVRRKALLCWLSDSLRTMDRFTAFRNGVDLIINRRDLNQVKLIFQRALREHEMRYRLFNELGKQKGVV